MTRRAGFTLWEMTIVLVIMGVGSLLVVPAASDFGRTPSRRTGGDLLQLLARSRRAAIASHVTVTLLIDPISGEYRIDSIGRAEGGTLAQGKLDLTGAETMTTTLPRLRFVFEENGAAQGDTVRVHGVDSTVVIGVDRWSGVAHATR